MSVVRRLLPEDADLLRPLRLRSLREHPLDFGAHHDDEGAWPLEKWAASLRDVAWFGAFQHNALIGCAILRVPDGLKLRHNGWVHAMYVAPEAQGAGASDAIMDAIETYARERAVRILKLYVREGNFRAERFYHRRGFVQYGREPDSHVVEGLVYHSLELAKRLA
jgi:GNAT superfamily N-acetyltransferase